MSPTYRRRGRLGSLLLLAVLALVALRPPDQHAPGHAGADGWRSGPRPARVERVIDGDTIAVRIGGRSEEVRYIGVDTPETVKPGTPVQCHGPQASDFNHRLLEGRRVRLRFDRERRDVYGRLLAYVYLGRRFVNAELVRRGHARTLTIPPNDRFAGPLARLERVAGRRGAGLWSECGG